MKYVIKAIFIDFDGTLYDHKNNEVPSSSIEAIKKARENGVLVYLCSGRLLDEMSGFDLSELDLDGYILANGALITDKDYRPIVRFPVSKLIDEKLRNLFEKKLFPIVIFDEQGSYVNFNNDYSISTLKGVNTPAKKEIPLRDLPILCATCYFGNKENSTYIDDIRNECYSFYWHEYTANILNKNVTKLSAINEVLKVHNIPLCYTMAIGDASNDIPMIKHCGIGVCMGQADELTKKESDYITEAIDENGLYNALKHFGVI